MRPEKKPYQHGVRNSALMICAVRHHLKNINGSLPDGSKRVTNTVLVIACLEYFNNGSWVLISGENGYRFREVVRGRLIMPTHRLHFSADELEEAADALERAPQFNVFYSKRLWLAASIYDKLQYTVNNRICEAAILTAMEYGLTWDYENIGWL